MQVTTWIVYSYEDEDENLNASASTECERTVNGNWPRDFIVEKAKGYAGASRLLATRKSSNVAVLKKIDC